ncbi:helix-turn-helix domain-containing protein [Bacillus paralicheniformis]|uniref:helix-turn-helix domain-containing protein n=1 Tax=Bacillus paralicheniformis TaxID=1648923 RepID=UPI00203A7822|nr:helix-turn-helix domain-containing protein [Bacillus paralicheniformis]MCM3425583.1 helix-turn-helix domain-containing protein [Bacillus paralicheniformis]
MEKLLTPKQLSEILQVSIETLRRWRKEGMPYKQIGRSVRFNQEEVEKWIEENKGN